MRFVPLAAMMAAVLMSGCGKNTQTAALKGDAVRGKEVFNANCAGCHLPTGKGRMPGQPDFTNAAWQAKEEDEELLSVIHKGKERMPAFQGKLTDQQISDALAYVRTFPKQAAK